MQNAITRRAPTRSTSRPENGIATSDPTAANSSANPSPRSSASRLSRTAGIRATQPAKSAPLAANTIRVAQACRRTDGAAVGAACRSRSVTEPG